MKKNYIAPAIKEERVFEDDILVVIGSGGRAASAGVTDADAREIAIIEQMNANEEPTNGLW